MSKKQWEAAFKNPNKKFVKNLKPRNAVVRFSKLLKKQKMKRVLDLGCGSGRHVVYLAKKKFFVVGSDIAPTALKLTSKWCKKENVENFSKQALVSKQK